MTPIASLTKLMTAMVVLDAGLPLDEPLAVDMDDFDYLKGSHSRLRMGATLSRGEMLRLALMASENRAASSLARHYPGGSTAFVAAMNAKAAALGMTQHALRGSDRAVAATTYRRANDLARMVNAAAAISADPRIHDHARALRRSAAHRPMLGFNNSNSLVKNVAWDIQLQKTGYIREAGRCVVMLATIASRPMVIVLLDSLGKYTRMGDAQRIKHGSRPANRCRRRSVKAGQGQAPVAQAGQRLVRAKAREQLTSGTTATRTGDARRPPTADCTGPSQPTPAIPSRARASWP